MLGGNKSRFPFELSKNNNNRRSRISGTKLNLGLRTKSCLFMKMWAWGFKIQVKANLWCEHHRKIINIRLFSISMAAWTQLAYHDNFSKNSVVGFKCNTTHMSSGVCIICVWMFFYIYVSLFAFLQNMYGQHMCISDVISPTGYFWKHNIYIYICIHTNSS